MSNEHIKIDPSWKQALNDEFNKPYFPLIRKFILGQQSSGKRIYPPGSLIFQAFNLTPFTAVKVVILGQDPYHQPGQAHGLCFSVQRGVKVPASLVNIYKELKSDLGISPPHHGNLESWALQGVLLLNASLTVNEGEPNSHANCGWQLFTDAVIKKISDEKEGVVFLLWGNFARAKKALIDTNKHFVLEAAHPSPLAGNAFQGCKHFSKTNEILKQQNKLPINWSIEE
ncbi:MAG: uracil-DNA glycosylase [Bacteroidetes bacterium]|nr:uracil-DNA glycosylase [Bacteroidota bacterium]